MNWTQNLKNNVKTLWNLGSAEVGIILLTLSTSPNIYFWKALGAVKSNLSFYLEHSLSWLITSSWVAMKRYCRIFLTILTFCNWLPILVTWHFEQSYWFIWPIMYISVCELPTKLFYNMHLIFCKSLCNFTHFYTPPPPDQLEIWYVYVHLNV